MIWGAEHSYRIAGCYRRILKSDEGDEDKVWPKYRALKEALGRSGASTANNDSPAPVLERLAKSSYQGNPSPSNCL